jgi:hypothetical protein
VLTAAAFALALGTAPPAGAALSGTDWTEQTLPANDFIAGGGTPLSPVSCVPGTQFCVVIANDSANLVDNTYVGQAAVVTTDAGQNWTGYALPSTVRVTALSCPSTSVCWVSGTSWAADIPEVAESTDGGQTWTDMTPAAWSTATWWPNAIDCPTTTTCWLAGLNYGTDGQQNPAAAMTSDGGTTWTTFSNLPTIVQYDPNGTYELDGISCVSADSCVVVGGLNEGDGKGVVITTADGGTTWTLSASPKLAHIQEFFSVSCLPAADGKTTCFGAGAAHEAAGPISLVSHNGGVTWTERRTFDDTGWLNSISCATTANCWAAGSGTTVALVGTADKGKTWTSVTSDTSNQDGSVSCLSIGVCVATTDNGLWVTSDDGGLATSG